MSKYKPTGNPPGRPTNDPSGERTKNFTIRILPTLKERLKAKYGEIAEILKQVDRYGINKPGGN